MSNKMKATIIAIAAILIVGGLVGIEVRRSYMPTVSGFRPPSVSPMERVADLMRTNQIDSVDVLKYVATETYAFVGYIGAGCCGSKIDIYNISRPGTASKVGTYTTVQYISDFVLSDKYVIVAVRPTHPYAVPFISTFEVIDVSDPRQPTVIATPSIGRELVTKLEIRDGNLIAVGEFGTQTIDISDPHNFRVISSVPNTSATPHNLPPPATSGH